VRPAPGPTSSGAPAGASAPPAPAVLLKVLLVEPSRTQSGIIRKYLAGQEVQEIVAVATGKEALQAVASNPPHVIISALHLPDMKGVHLAQQVRATAKAPTPGFVLISSESQSAEAAALSTAAQSIVLQKPFTPRDLIEAMGLVVGRRLTLMPISPDITGLSLAGARLPNERGPKS
jgi:CheY-like chemotaxis protein